MSLLNALHPSNPLSLMVTTVNPSPSPSPREFTDDNVQPGPGPLLLISLLLAASWFLVRSMRTHLRRIPPDLDVQLRPDADGDAKADS
jgi:hypothetical protein